MKKGVLKLWLLMVFGVLFADCQLLMAFECGSSEVELSIDNKKVIEAFMRQAKHFMENGDYISAKNKLEKVLELNENHAEAIALLGECQTKIEQQRAAERDALNSAISARSIKALRDFIEQYPKSEYVSQAEDCIEDFELWTATINKNTKAAFQDYLSKSKVLGFQLDAENNIRNIEAEEAWVSCHNSSSIEKLESFVNRYSGTSHTDEARYELDILRAENCYQQNEHDFALTYYKKANSFRALTGDRLKHYNELLQEEQYNKLKKSYELTDLMDFLKHLSTDSPYYNPISNKIAVIKANNLTSYSSEMDMDVALCYAKDEVTKGQVKQRISDVKKQKRINERSRRKRRRQTWWEDRVTLGWNMIGFDLDPSLDLDLNSDDDLPATCSLETGLRMRFGRFDDVFNITIGADYQNYWGKYMYYGYYNQEARYQTIHQRLAFPVNLKLNINGGNETSSFFVACSAEFGFEMNEFVDYIKCFFRQGGNNNGILMPSIAIEPQIGFNHKHFDWGLYYRYYLNGYRFMQEEYSVGNKRFGIYMTVYF